MLAFSLFLGIVGSLTLVVGGIGVSNIMNVVVDERTKEIGVKMALGAKSGAILRQFLVETLIVTAIGGAVGFAISLGICAVFPASLQEYVGKPEVSPVVALDHDRHPRRHRLPRRLLPGAHRLPPRPGRGDEAVGGEP